MQQIREKMDLINLDEENIDAEVLDCAARNYRRSAHCHLGRCWWFGEGQIGAAGDSPIPRRPPREVHQIWYVAVERCIVLWSSRYW